MNPARPPSRRVPPWLIASAALLLAAWPFAEVMPFLGTGWIRSRSPVLLRSVAGGLLFLVMLVSIAWVRGFAEPRGPRWLRAAAPALFAVAVSWWVARSQGGMEAFLDEERRGRFDGILFACGLAGAALGALLSRRGEPSAAAPRAGSAP